MPETPKYRLAHAELISAAMAWRKAAGSLDGAPYEAARTLIKAVDAYATFAAGSSPDTTPPPVKVKLMTAWVPFRFIEYDDLGVKLGDEVEAHRDHQVVGAWSAFGWRELRCVSCDVTVWSITTPEAKP